MRKVMYLIAMAIVAGAVASFGVSSATATTSSPWYTVSVKLTGGVHTLKMDTSIVNVGTVTHSAWVTVSLRGPNSFGMNMLPVLVKLAPGQTWQWGFPTSSVPKGTYAASVSASHVFEKNDPGDLQGAMASAIGTALVR